MPVDPESLSQKRQQSLQRLRERKRDNRHSLYQRGGKADDDMPLEYFVKLPDLVAAETSTLEAWGSDHEKQLSKIRERLREARTRRRNLKSQASKPVDEVLPEGETSTAEPAGSQRGKLLQEVVSNHFRDNLKSWVSSVEPDFGVSSTSLEELEEYQQKVEYRHKILKLLLDETQRELNKLEIHIRATKSLEN